MHSERVEATQPYPPRFWWLKRLAGMYLTFAGVVALLYWGWSEHSYRKFDQAIEAVRARGEPILPQDFYPSAPIPDEQNAAIVLKTAGDLLKADPNWSNLADRVRNFGEYGDQSPPDDLTPIEPLLAKHTAELNCVREARAMPRADWGVHPHRRIYNTLLPDLTQQRELAGLVALSALERHAHGDDVEALQRCRDLLAQANHVEQYLPADVVEMVGWRSVGQAHDVLEAITPRLGLDSADAREQAKALQTELLDERATATDWLRCCQYRRTNMRDIFLSYVQPYRFFPGPLMRYSAVRAMEAFDVDVAAARSSNFTDAQRLIRIRQPRWMNEEPPYDKPLRQFSSVYDPRLLKQTRMLSDIDRGLTTTWEAYFRTLTERRMSAVRIAFARFTHDHDGGEPSRWEVSCRTISRRSRAIRLPIGRCN